MKIYEDLKIDGFSENIIGETFLPDSLQKINRLSDDEWTVTHPATLEENTFRWSEQVPLVTTANLILFKQYMRSRGKSEVNGRLIIKNHQDHLNQARWLLHAIGEIGVIKRLHEFTQDEVLSLITKTIRNRKSVLNSVAAHSTIEKRWHFISRISQGYLSSSYIDGFTDVPPYPSVLEALKPIVSEANDWATWLAEGSYGSVPLPIAMTYIDEAIEIIRSPNKRWYEFLTLFFRENQPVSSTFLYQIVRASNRKWELPAARQKTQLMKKFIAEAKVFFEIEPDKQLHEFPFTDGYDIENFSCLLHAAALIIFFSVTGARRSEIHSIQDDDLIKGNDGKYKFKSDIKKTNHSISTVRHIAGLAAEAYDAIKSVKLFPESDQINIFIQTTFKWNNAKEKTIYHGSYQNIPIRLKLFAEYIEKKYGEEFSYSEDISPHQFRHTFAEFALRRFDGNVFSAIRDHFRHNYGSFMTNHYIRRKIYEGLESEDINELSDLLKGGSTVVRDYIKELIKRTADGEKMFGATGQWIMERVRNIKFLNPQTIEEIINDFDGELHPHEYGICLVRKETKMQAKCFDKSTGTAKTEEARWNLCGNCANRLSFGNNRDAIMRIGMKSQEHAESFKKAGLTAIADIETQNIKLAMAAINEFDKGEGGDV